MHKISYLKLGLCALALSGLQGCAVAAGLGVAGGVAAVQEGGLSRAASDARIQATINHLWFQYSTEVFSKLDLTVTQGRVLITGIVQDPEHRVEAVRLAWQPRGVTQVINEINVNEGRGVGGYARDTWIATKLRTALTFDKQVQSINYNIDVVQGSVYLMGIAQNQAELNRVISVARTISDVKQVVSYVKFAGDGNVLNEGGYQPRTPQEGELIQDNYNTEAASDAEAIDWGEGNAPSNLSTQSSSAVESETLLWGDNR